MIKSVTTDKGGRAEEGLAAHFRGMGFFALRGLPFRHDEEEITDVDVWLYERGAGAERRRFIVDAKNKARPKLVERLFWTSGARDALGIDGAYVASAGIREATRRLAKRLRISVVDLQTVTIDETAIAQRLTREELSRLVGDADRNRDSKKWRNHLHDTLAALLTSFGGSSANVALRSASYFADQVLTATMASPTCQLATRAFYLSVSAVAIGLDYVVAQTAYQAADRQLQEVEDTVRYGSDHAETKRRLDLALEVTRQYLANGAAQANQLREKIASETEAFRADVIAEVALKMGRAGSLFDAAIDLEMAAHRRQLPAYSSLSVEARSFCGAVMDFFELDRAQLAGLLDSGGGASAPNFDIHPTYADEG
jgi:hypothetical protein